MQGGVGRQALGVERWDASAAHQQRSGQPQSLHNASQKLGTASPGSPTAPSPLKHLGQRSRSGRLRQWCRSSVHSTPQSAPRQ